MSQPSLRYALDWGGKGVTDVKAWLRRMINHPSNRFVEHPSFVFHVGNVIQRRIAKSASAQYIKKFCSEGDPSVAEVQEWADSNINQFLRSVHSYTSQIQGTDAYWNNVRHHCESVIRHNIIRGRGLPSFFITSSCAEFHHQPLCRLVSEAVAKERILFQEASMLDPTHPEFGQPERVNPLHGKTWLEVSKEEYDKMNTDDKYRRQKILKHSHITVRFFEARTKQYINSVLKPVWGIRDFFFRFEFAEGRGQIHFHGIFWREDMRPHGLFQEANGNMEKFEANLHDFMSNLGFTTRHTSGDSQHWPPPEGTMTVPQDSNVLRRGFEVLSGLNSSTDCSMAQIDFDNKLTLHVCSGGYCHGRGGTRAKECKWGFGGKNDVKEYDHLKGLYGSKTLSNNFHLERDCRNRLHPCMPRNHPRRLCAAIQQWRLMGCNMDHQPFLCLDDPMCPTSDNTFVCADYMCAYCCKGNPKPAVAVQVYRDTLDLIASSTPDRPRTSIISTLMCKSIGERHIPHQQAVFENSGAHSWSSSFQFVTLGMSLSRRFKPRGSTTTGTDNPAPSDSTTLEENTVDRYVRTVKYIQGVSGSEHGENLRTEVKTKFFSDMTGQVADEDRIVSVADISLYDYASTGKNQDSPIGTFVPLATGQSHILKPTWPLRPDYCLQMLRLHSPGFIYSPHLCIYLCVGLSTHLSRYIVSEFIVYIKLGYLSI